MKNTKKKVILSIFLLIFACLFVFTACNDGNGGKVEDTTAENQEEIPAPELNVSFDEGATYQFDEASIADALDVAVVSNGVSRKVEFSIKSSTITEDGNYIEVVIAAEDFEKTVRLPYEAPLPEIRDELIPIYKLITKSGDKAISLTASASSVSGESGEAKDLVYKAVINKTANGIEFALVDKTFADDKALVLFKDGALTACGTTVSLDDIMARLDADAFDISEIDFTIDRDEAASVFESLSGALDTVDSLLESSAVSLFNIAASHSDGVYTLRADSSKIVLLIQLLYGANETVDVNQIVDTIDGFFDGALKAGDIEFEVSLTIKEERLAAGIAITDKRTNDRVSIDLSLEIAEEAFALPEAFEPETPQIKITVPFKLPQKNVDAALNAVVHISEIVNGADANYVTANISFNEEASIAAAVLNNRYVYIDMSRIAAMVGAPETSEYKFAYEFEIDGEPATLFEVVAAKLFGRASDSDETPEDDGNVDYGTDEDPRFANGYGARFVDDEEKFPIGTTEEELRQHLFVYTFDEDDNEIPFTDYTIEDFDGSSSFAGTVTIKFAEGYEFGIYVIVYDSENVEESSFKIDSMHVAKGTDVASLQANMEIEVTMTDGQIYWYVYEEGTGVIDAVNGQPVTAEYVFDTTGDFLVTVNRNDDLSYVLVSVYDPENLKAVEFDCFGTVFMNEETTDEEIRNQIYAYVTYDNGEQESVEDFEIVDFTYGDAYMNISWGEFSDYVSVEYGGGSAPEDEPTSIISYIRIENLVNEDGEIDIAAIFAENKELLGEIFIVNEDKNGIRIIVNSKTDRDLLAIVNKYFGIPAEDGFVDIDENYILSLANFMGMDLSPVVGALVGVNLNDMLSELVVDIKISDGLKIELGDGGEIVYIATGLNIGFTEGEDIIVTEADLEGAQEISKLPNTLLQFAMAIILPLMMQ